jgi:hypothetical protein
MTLWKSLGVAILLIGLLDGLKCLFDLVERNRWPKR